MKKSFLSIVCALVFTSAFTQSASSSGAIAPALSSIREDELRKDLFAMASDSMRGRRAGTIDELRAAGWVAEQARKAGLQPAGDDGTYFQFFSLRRTQTAPGSKIQIDGKSLALWQEAWVTAPVEAHINAPVMWLKTLGDTAANLQGKVAAMTLHAPAPLPAPGISLWGYRYTLLAVRQQSNLLKAHGAAAVILVADAAAEASLGFAGHNFEEGLYQLEGSAAVQNNGVPVIIVRPAVSAGLQQPNAKVTLDLGIESYLYPSVNVIAKASGTDPLLKNEYVLFSGHHDHDGVGVPAAGDSIWNGADDNASVSVALLAIGRAWVAKPGKRSALFIWHGAEERGLLGSRWYAEHPTVKKESIAAVLNGDMFGRNNPDSAALLGVTAPHRNSLDLAQAAMQANRQLTHFKIDTSWDSPQHPEGWYFRSDHLSYARAGIPAIFFTTLLHPDYHTPRDEPQRIDMAKLTRMAQWVYATGWIISNTASRPALDPDFKLER